MIGLAILGAAAGWVLAEPAQYRSAAELVFRPETVRSATQAGDTVPDVSIPASLVDSRMRLVRGEPLIGEVVDQLSLESARGFGSEPAGGLLPGLFGAEPDATDSAIARDRAIRILANGVTVQPGDGRPAIRIGVTAADSTLSMSIVNAVAAALASAHDREPVPAGSPPADLVVATPATGAEAVGGNALFMASAGGVAGAALGLLVAWLGMRRRQAEPVRQIAEPESLPVQEAPAGQTVAALISARRSSPPPPMSSASVTAQLAADLGNQRRTVVEPESDDYGDAVEPIVPPPAVSRAPAGVMPVERTAAHEPQRPRLFADLPKTRMADIFSPPPPREPARPAARAVAQPMPMPRQVAEPRPVPAMTMAEPRHAEPAPARQASFAQPVSAAPAPPPPAPHRRARVQPSEPQAAAPQAVTPQRDALQAAMPQSAPTATVQPGAPIQPGQPIAWLPFAQPASAHFYWPVTGQPAVVVDAAPQPVPAQPAPPPQAIADEPPPVPNAELEAVRERLRAFGASLEAMQQARRYQG